METEYLYSLAERENIDVIDYYFSEELNGIYIENLKCIGLNKSLEEIEKKCTLAEELGHYYCNATYPLSCSDETLIRKAEYRAKKYQTKILVLPSDIERIKEKNLKYKWEIAEELNVTEEVAERAVAYYTVNERVI